MKKLFKILWKCLLGAAAVVVVFIGVALAIAWGRDYRRYYVDKRLSKNVTVRYYYKQGDYRVHNREENKITIKGLTNVVCASEGDSLSVFFKDGLRGFLNVNTGYEVIPAQYKHAWVFSEGLAAVVDGSGKIGFINKENEVVIPCRYTYRKNQPIDYYFNNGYCVMTDERGACGVIDVNGRWVMEPKYDTIWKLHFGKYRIVKDGEKYGMIDENLHFVFPIEYDRIEFAEHEHDGVLLTKGHVKQHVAFDGTVINPFVIDAVEGLYYQRGIEPMEVQDKYGDIEVKIEVQTLADYVKYRVNGAYGVMHRETGRIVLPALYDEVDMVSPTLIEAQLSGTYDFVVFDTQGNRVH